MDAQSDGRYVRWSGDGELTPIFLVTISDIEVSRAFLVKTIQPTVALAQCMLTYGVPGFDCDSLSISIRPVTDTERRRIAIKNEVIELDERSWDYLISGGRLEKEEARADED